MNGIKRHTVVDTEGNLIDVVVTGAGVSDTAGGLDLLVFVKRKFPTLHKLWVDSGYKQSFLDRAGELLIDAEVVRPDPDQRGFVVHQRRWVVERTFAWLSRARRLSRDFERSFAGARAMMQVAYIRMMLRRLSRSTD